MASERSSHTNTTGFLVGSKLAGVQAVHFENEVLNLGLGSISVRA